VDAGQVVKRA